MMERGIKSLLVSLWMLVSCSAFGAGVPYIFNLYGHGTNTALHGTNFQYMYITNENSNPTNLWIDNVLGAGRAVWAFSRTPMDLEYGYLYLNTTHDGGQPSGSQTEWQWVSPHHIAISSGYQTGHGHIQIGIGAVDATHGHWVYMQNLPTLTTPGLGFSGAITYLAAFNRSDGVQAARYPGFFAQSLSHSAGTYVLRLVGELNTNDLQGVNNLSDAWSTNTVMPGVDFMFKTNAFQSMNVYSNLNVSGELSVTNDSWFNGISHFGAAADHSTYDAFSWPAQHLWRFGGGGGTSIDVSHKSADSSTSYWNSGPNTSGGTALEVGGASSAGGFAVRTGPLYATNGVASFSPAAAITIAATGWTNIWSTNNATVYVTPTATTFKIIDRNRVGLYTSPTLSTTIAVTLQPGWAVTNASGLAGTAVPW